MPDTNVVFHSAGNSPATVAAIDTNTSDGPGNEIYRLGVDMWDAAVQVAPADFATTSNVQADVPGSTIDTLHYTSLSYTIANVGANSITWQVLGANRADFTGAVVVKAPAAVAAAASDSYTVFPAPFRFYKVQAADTVNGTHGTARVNGLAKG